MVNFRYLNALRRVNGRFDRWRLSMPEYFRRDTDVLNIQPMKVKNVDKMGT